MKTKIMILGIGLLLGQFSFASESELEDCSRRSDAQLCMSKVLLRAIESNQGGRPGRPGGPGNGFIGQIKFYHDDGRCSSNVIGGMFFTADGGRNKQLCQEATVRDSIWGVGIVINGSEQCFDIGDTSSPLSACQQALPRVGIPIAN
ncbi:MAG: hypothetical protein M9962_07250 [Oligoflexia bacterium]|nr:hypothetical protein [Oligoflexia bacterium]